MKLVNVFSYLMIFMALVTFTIIPSGFSKEGGKTDMSKIKKDTKELFESLNDYTQDQKKELSEKSEKLLNRLDDRIDELEDKLDSKWEEMDQTARKETRDALRNLRTKRKKVAEWYGGVKNSSKNAWKDVKDGFSKSYKELYKTWEKVEEEFKKNSSKE